jgi:hypothetical protein
MNSICPVVGNLLQRKMSTTLSLVVVVVVNYCPNYPPQVPLQLIESRWLPPRAVTRKIDIVARTGESEIEKRKKFSFVNYALVPFFRVATGKARNIAVNWAMAGRFLLPVVLQFITLSV